MSLKMIFHFSALRNTWNDFAMSPISSIEFKFSKKKRRKKWTERWDGIVLAMHNGMIAI